MPENRFDVLKSYQLGALFLRLALLFALFAPAVMLHLIFANPRFTDRRLSMSAETVTTFWILTASIQLLLVAAAVFIPSRIASDRELRKTLKAQPASLPVGTAKPGTPPEVSRAAILLMFAFGARVVLLAGLTMVAVVGCLATMSLTYLYPALAASFVGILVSSVDFSRIDRIHAEVNGPLDEASGGPSAASSGRQTSLRRAH
jgi:hypothetical protein